MIESLLNLVCANGHRWFSPTPEYWLGKECQKGEGANVCRAKLDAIAATQVGPHDLSDEARRRACGEPVAHLTLHS